MSWLFSKALMKDYENSRSLPGPVEEYSAANCSDGARCAQSNTTNTPAMYLSHGKTTDASNLSRFGMMCELLTESLGAELLTWFRAGFRVKTSAQQEKDVELMGNEVGFGQKCSESLARYDQGLSLWKTAQCSLFEDYTEYVETWPRWGMILNGELLELTNLGDITNESVSGLWPTIVKNEGPGGMCLKLTDAVAIKEGYKPRYHQCHGKDHLQPFTGKVNPTWAEWLMGWPMMWTGALKESVMDKFQQWYALHGMSCAKESGRKKDE